MFWLPAGDSSCLALPSCRGMQTFPGLTRERQSLWRKQGKQKSTPRTPRVQTLMHSFSISTHPLPAASFSRCKLQCQQVLLIAPAPGNTPGQSSPAAAGMGSGGAWKFLCSQPPQPWPHLTPWLLCLCTALTGGRFHQCLQNQLRAVTWRLNPPLCCNLQIRSSSRDGIKSQRSQGRLAFPWATPSEKAADLLGSFHLEGAHSSRANTTFHKSPTSSGKRGKTDPVPAVCQSWEPGNTQCNSAWGKGQIAAPTLMWCYSRWVNVPGTELETTQNQALPDHQVSDDSHCISLVKSNLQQATNPSAVPQHFCTGQEALARSLPIQQVKC